jgi:hypothetical protein
MYVTYVWVTEGVIMAVKKIMVKVGKRKWELTPKQGEIVRVLSRSRVWLGPTEIAQDCGRTHDANVWSNAPLKRLLEDGVVKRDTAGPNKGKYQVVR